MRTIEEQIFDRRCKSAEAGDEASVRFYDELLGEYSRLDKLQQELEEELSKDYYCDECSYKDNKIEDLEDEIAALQEQIQHGNP